MKALHKRLASNSSIDARFNPLKTYVSNEHKIDILQQTGASNRKHYIKDKLKTYKRFSNQ